MSVLDELLAGAPYDPSVLGLAGQPFNPALIQAVLAGDAPGVTQSAVPGAQFSFSGSAFIAVPGAKGDSGTVAGTLPYAQITGKPAMTYLFTQATPADIWDVTHSLGFYPAVTVMDSAGSVVQGDVTHLDDAHLRLAFSAPFSGNASLT